MVVVAHALEELHVGDRVKVELQPGLGLRLTGWTYGIPTIFLVLGAVGGHVSALALEAQPDGWAALGGLLLGAFSMMIIILWQRQKGRIAIQARRAWGVHRDPSEG